jgi:hypothetical protein
LSIKRCSKQDHYICRRKINTVTHAGAGWSLCTLTLLWTHFFTLWKAQNEAIHGYDQSNQQQARCRKLCMEVELLHLYQDKVLASNTNTFIGGSPADLAQYFDVATAL